LELSTLIDHYGPKEAQRIWEFAISGVDIIRRNIEENKIQCDYQVQDSLFIARSKAKNSRVKDEYEGRRQLKYDAIFYKKNELSKVIGSSDYFSAVRYPETFGASSYLFCQGMREVLVKMGVKVFEGANVCKIDDKGAHLKSVNGRDGSSKQSDGSFICQAESIIYCGDRFIPDMAGMHKADIFHGQTFLAVSKPLSEAEVKAIFPSDKLMAWDTDLIYQYFRITGENRLLIGGSNIPLTYSTDESHPAEWIYKKLCAYLKEMFPNVHIELEYMWPGLIGVTKDFLPVLARDPKLQNVWYAGAAAGIPWSAALGKYAVDKVLDGRKDFDIHFDPKRFASKNWLQALIGRKLSFAIFQGLRKL